MYKYWLLIILNSTVVFFLLQVNEMEVNRMVAERKLREHKGNVVEALTELVR